MYLRKKIRFMYLLCALNEMTSFFFFLCQKNFLHCNFNVLDSYFVSIFMKVMGPFRYGSLKRSEYKVANFFLCYNTAGLAQSWVVPTLTSAGQLMVICWPLHSSVCSVHIVFFDHSAVKIKLSSTFRRLIELVEPCYEKGQECFLQCKHKYHNK